MLNVGDIQAAFDLFAQGAAKGEVKCVYGQICARALQEKEFDEFIPIMQNALDELLCNAQDGDSDACFIIGRCYEKGIAVMQNIENAKQFYTRSSELGNTDAMFNLGCILMAEGKPDEAAAKYFLPASKLGNESAKRAFEHYCKHRKSLL